MNCVIDRSLPMHSIFRPRTLERKERERERERKGKRREEKIRRNDASDYFANYHSVLGGENFLRVMAECSGIYLSVMSVSIFRQNASKKEVIKWPFSLFFFFFYDVHTTSRLEFAPRCCCIRNEQWPLPSNCFRNYTLCPRNRPCACN